MASGRLEHVGIGAAPDKFDELIAFYNRVFGWHLIKASPGDLAFIGDGEGGRIEILAREQPPLAPPHHLAFVVDDLQATAQALREAGATLQEPVTNPFGDTLLFFTDPAGNYAQIIQRIEPLAR